VHERFVHRPTYEGANYVGILHVGEIGALPGEAANVVTESFSHILPAVPQVPRDFGAYLCVLEVANEDAPEVTPRIDAPHR
jgi:hypothetical protein